MVTKVKINFTASSMDNIYPQKGTVVFDNILERLSAIRTRSRAKFSIVAALLFIGKPYATNALNCGKREVVSADISAFDCVSFVESVIAISLLFTSPMRRETITTADFINTLRQIRYRNGKVNSYASRLHYFSEWFEQNARGSVFFDVTLAFGGERKLKTINWMSKNAKSYPHLANIKTLSKIERIENRLSKNGFDYIPKERFDAVKNKLKTGDIVAFTTNKEGLDVVHCGFILVDTDTPRLLHASSSAERVVISDDDISAYIKNITI